MNRFCFVFYILLLVSLFDGRNITFASSKQRNSQPDNHSRFETLIELARKTNLTNHELAIDYAEQALTIGKEKQDQKMIAQAYVMLAIISYDAHNFTKTIEYTHPCIPIFEKFNDVKGLADLYNRLSSACFYIGNTEMSDIYSDKCIELAEKHQFLDILNKQYYNRGAIAFYRNDYSYSMEFAFKALNIAKKIEHPVYTAYCYDLLGNLSLETENFQKAIHYYKLSRMIYLEEGDKKLIEQIGQGYYNTAQVYVQLNQMDSVHLYYNKALNCYREAKSSEGLMIAYTGLANYYRWKGEIDSAQMSIEEGLKVAMLSESKKDLPASYNTAGDISFQQGHHQKASDYYREALLWALQIGNREAEATAKFNLGRNFAATQHFDSAHHYLSQSFAIKDSMDRFSEVQKRSYAFAEHLVKEQYEKEMESEQLKRQLWLAIVGLCILVIALLSIFIRYMFVRQKKIKSINAELNTYKSELEYALKSKTLELALREQQVMNLSNNLPNGAIFRFSFENTNEGKMLFISSGWEDLTGQSIETVEDSVCFFRNGIHPEDSHKLLKALAFAINSHTILDMLYRFYRDGTELRWFHVRAMAIAGDDALTYLDGYLVDETQQKQFEQDLIASRNRAEESDKLKSAFLANMSHEVRTPMNAIVGFSTLLSSTQLTHTRQASYLELVQENCQRLLQLIDAIVDVAKIEAGQLNLRMETFPLSKLMTDISEYFEPFINVKHSFVELWIDEDLLHSSLTVNTDFLRLRQIFVNLIENALKFTEKGFIRCAYLLDRPGAIHFYVMDTGSGISQKNTDVIFQTFRKVDQFSGGTGLGLSIVKKLLLQMGGDIWVESEPDVGSTFHFTIPLTETL